MWKPRTKPGGFEGVGERALKWLQRVKRETGMLVGTEVATPEHVELCLQHDIDLLWIGARTTANPFAVQSLADCLQGVDVPVLVKNPVSPDLELWIGAMQRLNQAGIQRIGAIHRGFSSYNNKLYRNNPTWQIPIELRRRIPELPIIGDPSHIGGKRDLIAASYGFGLRWSHHRNALHPRQGLERCCPTSHSRRASLHSLAPRCSRQTTTNGRDCRLAPTNR